MPILKDWDQHCEALGTLLAKPLDALRPSMSTADVKDAELYLTHRKFEVAFDLLTHLANDAGVQVDAEKSKNREAAELMEVEDRSR